MSASEGHLSYVGLGGRGTSRRVATSASGRHPQREAGACTSDRISRGSFSNYRRLTGWAERCRQSTARAVVIWLDIQLDRLFICIPTQRASCGPLIVPRVHRVLATRQQRSTTTSFIARCHDSYSRLQQRNSSFVRVMQSLARHLISFVDTTCKCD